MAATIPRNVAVKLLSESEFRLYEASRRGRIDDHGATDLRTMIAATRRLRDKYRSLVKQQKGEGRGKRTPRGAAPAQGAEGTKNKVTIFADILERFESALERADARPRPERPEGRAAGRPRGDKASRARAAGEKEPPSESPSTATRKAATKGKASTAGDANKAATKGKASTAGAAKKAAGKAASAKARSAKAPTGAQRERKGQTAAARTRSAHTKSRGQRRQGRRDR